ncbi:MAG: hypothetical protein P1U82_03210 [Verrucomicrobiales bacterium]|jgi:hypothetical protein|nr:hypothetical protein [Verrucomicrobiales bacterium]MDF1784852.1 hypothetical protein [Verrucomicrobiales bacterium]
MCKGGHLGFLRVLALLLVVYSPFETACQTPSALRIALDQPNIRLNWPATVGAWTLQSTEDPTDPGGWIFQTHELQLVNGSLFLSLPIETPQRLFRLCTLSILFVDAAHAQSGNAKVIYVFLGVYHEAVHIDGTGLDGYYMTLLDYTTPIGLDGQLIGAKDSAVAQLTATDGSPALTATHLANFRLAGFQLTGLDGSGGDIGQPGMAAPAVISLDRTTTTIECVVVLGGNSGRGEKGLMQKTAARASSSLVAR